MRRAIISVSAAPAKPHMNNRFSTFLRTAAMAVLCPLALFVSPAAGAQTITNVASASWVQNGQTVTAASNAVSFSKVAAPASIITYTVAPGTTTALNFMPSECGGVPIPGTGTIGSGTQVAGISASVVQSSTVAIGDVFYFEVNAPQANLHPNAEDSIQVTLTTTSGDKETVTVFETGNNTGIFVGAVPTVGIPPQPVQGDCKLSVSSGDSISITALIAGTPTPIATAQLSVSDDPFGFVFDSESGASVNGAKVTLINATTGQPAKVFAPDGVTPWPATVTTGASVVDSAGMPFQMQPGEYRFPVVAAGEYKLVVQPPTPYTAPSTISAQNLAGILRPDGTPVQVVGGSYGEAFSVGTVEALRIDIPVDKPGSPVTMTKSASRATAQSGDVVFYTLSIANPQASAKRNVVVVDKASRSLRIKPKSVRIDGVANPGWVQFSPDGTVMTVIFPTMAASSTHTVTYAASVVPNATPGQAPNTATVTDSRGFSTTSQAVVQVIADMLTDRMTLIGRIIDGSCTRKGPHEGIPGVRVMLEDGSYAITDKDGRYHFDGLVPGDHVAQVAPSTLPVGGQFVDCGRSTRTAGSAISRFVSGQGGMLAVADFYAVLPAVAADTAKPAPTKGDDAKTADVDARALPPGVARPLSDKAAAGSDTDWLALGDGPTGFLFPASDHNPRSPAVRLVIRHRAGQKIELSANGKRVAPVAFDGQKVSADHSYAVSIWRGVPLDGDTTHFTAVVRNADGTVATTLTRDIHFTNVAAQVKLIPALTHLVADGTSRPVIALRILDRNGRPVHRGLAGDIAINAPYESAEAVNASQTRSLSGLGRAAPHWSVIGDDGIAYVELAPTMVSGAVHLDFNFDDGSQKRHQTIDSWVVPGIIPWTLVGLAEGALGSKTIADNMDRTGQFDSDLGTHARTAFYAKGRVLGKFLLTVAYDSAKQSADQSLGGAINPNAYYTVFADGTSRRFDAASRNKLYVRIEAKGFYALFGDFQTGFSSTQLARYNRALTGVTGEASIGNVHVKAFGAKTATTRRHLEIQGGGLSGPYSLGSAAMVANSETVTIQVRDRFRSEIIVSTTTLTAFVDYTVDLLSGTITFKQPILSHDANLDPQFIIVDYDVDPILGAADAMVGGARADWTSANGHLKIGATGLSDVGSSALSPTARTNLGAVDVKADLNATTQIRIEAAASRTSGVTSNAWQVEAEHHDKNLDVLAYVHSTDAAYGVGDTGNAELGWRKYGIDAKMRVGKQLSLITSAWIDDSLTQNTTQKAVQVKAQYHIDKTDLHLGVSALDDSVGTGAGATGTTSSGSSGGSSTILEAGASQKFLHDKLQIDATGSLAIGSATSANMPATDTITARYTLSPRVKLVASYEVASAGTLKTHTARAGFEATPWAGAKISAGTGEQQVAEYGQRSFAAFGLTQAWQVTKHLSIDGTVDANKVLSGFNAATIVNPAQPAVAGGQLDGSGTLTENFTALTLGAGWKDKLWTGTLRGEYRNGEFADRRGVTAGLIRQLGEGVVWGGGLTLTHASGSDGSRSSVLDTSVAFAQRPAGSEFALLGKMEFRSDKAVAATNSAQGLSASTITGVAGTAGDTGLTVNGNARSRRFIASLSANWSPRGHDDQGDFTQRTEIGLFAGARYNLDAYDGYNLTGTTLLGGVDAHIGITGNFDIGGTFTLRSDLSSHTSSYAVGPSVGFSPAKDVLLTVGYNVTGFRDPDFSANRNTNRGVFASLKMKFDTSTFGFLGLDGRPR